MIIVFLKYPIKLILFEKHEKKFIAFPINLIKTNEISQKSVKTHIFFLKIQ